MSKRLRPKAVATIERKKRIVTYVAVQREIVNAWPRAGGAGLSDARIAGVVGPDTAISR
jgi:hypothetical protein